MPAPVTQVRAGECGCDGQKRKYRHQDAQDDWRSEPVGGNECRADGRAEDHAEGDERCMDGVDQRCCAPGTLHPDGHRGFIVTPTKPMPSMNTSASGGTTVNTANPIRKSTFNIVPTSSVEIVNRSASLARIMLPTEVAAP